MNNSTVSGFLVSTVEQQLHEANALTMASMRRTESLIDTFGFRLTPPKNFVESPAHSSIAAVKNAFPDDPSFIDTQPLPHFPSGNGQLQTVGGQRGFLFDREPPPSVPVTMSVYLGNPLHIRYCQYLLVVIVNHAWHAAD